MTTAMTIVAGELDERPDRARLDIIAEHERQRDHARARAAGFRDVERKAKDHAENWERIAAGAESALMAIGGK